MSSKNEIWVDADKGGFYEGLYEVSNFGRWKIKPREVNSGWGQRKHIAKERIKTGTNSNGYRRVQMKRDGVRKQIDLHVLVGINFIPNPNNYPQILHKDDIRSNNHYENLEWGTQKENVRQCFERNRHWTTKGVDRENSKLDEEKLVLLKRIIFFK
jgi:hypothetical protein